MFKNLNAELARRGMTKKNLSEALGIPYSTLVPKLNGGAPLWYDEACNIKAVLNCELPLEELFAK